MEKQTRVWECLVEGSRTRVLISLFRVKALNGFAKFSSQLWETSKTPKTGLPNFGKGRREEKETVPRLGNTENRKNRVSQFWEAWKMQRIGLPKVGMRISRGFYLNLQSLSTTKNDERCTGVCPFRQHLSREKRTGHSADAVLPGEPRGAGAHRPSLLPLAGAGGIDGA